MAGTSNFSLLSRLLFIIFTWGCVPDLEIKPFPQTTQSFGEKFFTIICQRLAYSSSLEQRQLSTEPVDVSGSKYRLACHQGLNGLPQEAFAKDPKVATLVTHRAAIVEAVNRIFPEQELSNIQDYLTALLPLTDNDIFPDLTRRVSQFMQFVVDDQPFNQSMARLDTRLGYRPHEVAMGMAREIMRYPNLTYLTESLMDFIGEGGKGHQALMDLVEAISLELQTVQAAFELPHPLHPSDPNRAVQIGLDFLLMQDAALQTSSPPLYLVRRDWRGVAQVALDKQSKTLPQPFVDQDQDGLADIDELDRFITSNSPTAAPQPFIIDKQMLDTAEKRDHEGRALNQKSEELYTYLNLSNTVVATILRDGALLIDPSKRIAPKLLVGSNIFLGSRKLAHRSYGNAAIDYHGFESVDAALLDIIYAALQLLQDPQALDWLEVVNSLLQNHEDKLARLVKNIRRIKAISEQEDLSSAKLAPQSTLFTDLTDVLKKIAAKDNGVLLEDLLRALAHPKTAGLAGMIANYLRYKDLHLLDNQSQKIINPVYQQSVDRNQPDSGANRSIQQRLLHIIHNTHGMRWCNKPDACISLNLLGIDLCLAKFKPCDLFEIQNGALFYMQSIARLHDDQGHLTNTPKAHLLLKVENMPGWMQSVVNSVGIDSILEMMSGIKGLTSHPTPEAINRLMFLDPLPSTLQKTLDPAVDIDGQKVSSQHPGSLLSWEVPHPQYSCSPQEPCQFFEAMRPIIQAFADHQAEQLFLDFLGVLHHHWASSKSASHQFQDPRKPNFANGTAIVSFEPLFAEILEKTDILANLGALSQALIDTKLKNGQSAINMLARSIALMIDPQGVAELSYRPYLTTVTASDFSRLHQLFEETRDKKLAQCGATPQGETVYCKAGDTCLDANLALCTRRDNFSSSGQKMAGRVSLLDLFALAQSSYRDALARAKSKNALEVESWHQALSSLDDIFLEVKGEGASMRFKNRSLPALAKMLVETIKKRYLAHQGQKEIHAWLSQDLPLAIEKALTGPLMARLIDFFRILETDPKLKELICEFGSFLIDELNSNVAFRSSVASVADLAQLLQDEKTLTPILRIIGKALDPQLGLVKATLRFFKPAISLDMRDVLFRAMQNTYQEQTPGKTVLQTLLDLVTEIHRVKPGAGTAYDGRDFQETFKQSRDFIADQENGLLKLCNIMKERCVGPCTSP